MSPRSIPVRSTVLSALLLAVPVLAAADAWVLKPGEFYSEFRADHASSDRLFDADGKEHPLAQNGLEEGRGLLSYNEVGWKKRVGIVFAVPARSVSYRIGPPLLTRTSTGLADLLLGMRLKLVEGATALSAQLDWKAPLGYQREFQPTLGTGTQDVAARLNFGTALGSSGFIEVRGGYRYRFEEPLNEIEYSGELGWWVAKPLLIAAHGDGMSSIGNENADTGPKLKRYGVGGRATYRLDDRLDVFVGSRFQLAGSNVRRIVEYQLGVAAKRTSFNRLQGFLGGLHGP